MQLQDTEWKDISRLHYGVDVTRLQPGSSWAIALRGTPYVSDSPVFMPRFRPG